MLVTCEKCFHPFNHPKEKKIAVCPQCGDKSTESKMDSKTRAKYIRFLKKHSEIFDNQVPNMEDLFIELEKALQSFPKRKANEFIRHLKLALLLDAKGESALLDSLYQALSLNNEKAQS